MAHLEPARVDLAAWQAPLAAVTAEEFWVMDENASKGVNGDDGGVWAPSSAIVIGGVGLEVSSQLYVSGNASIGSSAADALDVNAIANFINDVTLGSSSADALVVNAIAEFNALATFDGNAIFNGAATFDGQVDFNDDVIFASTVTFDDPVVFSDDVTLGNGSGDAINVLGTLTVDEDAVFVGVVTAAEFAAPLASFDELSVDILVIPPGGAFVLNEPMTFATDGRIPWRFFNGTDTNAQILVTDGNVIEASISTARSYQIDDTGAQNGDWFIFYNDTIYALDILEPGGTPATLVNNLVQVSGTVPGFALLFRKSGAWKTIGVVSG